MPDSNLLANQPEAEEFDLDVTLLEVTDPAGLIRATARCGLDLTDRSLERVGCWLDWLRQVWAVEGVAEAVGHASPALAPWRYGGHEPGRP